MSDSKKLYRVVVAIAEKRDDEGKKTRDLKVVYDETEIATASEVKPTNIIRRDDIAEATKGIPAEEILVGVQEVALEAPFCA